MSRLNKGIYNVDIIPKFLDTTVNHASSLFMCSHLIFFYRLGLDYFFKKKLNIVICNVINL